MYAAFPYAVATYASLNISGESVSLVETVTITEAVIISVVLPPITETVTVTEYANATSSNDITRTELITITESVSISVVMPAIEESITVTESVACLPYLSIAETVTVVDIYGLPILAVNVTESIHVNDSLIRFVNGVLVDIWANNPLPTAPTWTREEGENTVWQRDPKTDSYLT